MTGDAENAVEPEPKPEGELRVPWPLRAARALVFSPPGAGLLLFLFSQAFAGIPPSGIAADESAKKFLLEEYGRTLAAIVVGGIAAHALAGLALGTAVALVLRAWHAALGCEATRVRLWLETLALAAVVESWAVLAVLVRYPQVFDYWLFEPGGTRREILLWATRHLAPGAVASSLALFSAALVLGPLAFARGRASAAKLVLESRERMRKRPLAFLALVVLAVVVVVAVKPGPSLASVSATADPERPDILMLGIDSLRPDRLTPEIAPHLTRLAAESVRFEQARTTLPRTYSSLTDLMTGRWPQHHGIRHMFPSKPEREHVGRALGHVLRERGYATAGITHDNVGAFSELDLGLDEHDRELEGGLTNELAASLSRRHLALLPLTTTALAHRLFPFLDSDWWNWDPERLADRTLEVLARAEKRGPAFVCSFFLTPHVPYAAPAPYCERFADAGYGGRFGFDATLVAVPETPADTQQLRGLYDGAVASCDAAVGRILDELEKTERGRRTIVVLFSDHGQNLGELDRGFGHGNHLRGEFSLRTVLLVRDRVHGFAPHAVPGIVRDVDVAPTIASLAGARLDGADGVDLAPLLRGEKTDLGLDAPSESELRFAAPEPDEIPVGSGGLSFLWTEDGAVVVRQELRERVLYVKERALRSANWKLHYKPTTKGARWRLYDAEKDPDEARDLSAAEPDVFRALRERLVAWATQDGWVFEDELFKPRKGFVLDGGH